MKENNCLSLDDISEIFNKGFASGNSHAQPSQKTVEMFEKVADTLDAIGRDMERGKFVVKVTNRQILLVVLSIFIMGLGPLLFSYMVYQDNKEVKSQVEKLISYVEIEEYPAEEALDN